MAQHSRVLPDDFLANWPNSGNTPVAGMRQRFAKDPLVVGFVVFLDGFSLTTLLLPFAARTADDVKLVFVVKNAATCRPCLSQIRSQFCVFVVKSAATLPKPALRIVTLGT